MKFDSAQRLAHLRRVMEIRSEAARKAQKRRNDLIAVLTAARRTLSDAEEAVELARYQDRDDLRKRLVDPAQARVTELEAAMKSADQECRAARDAATDAAQLFEAVQTYAKSQSLALPDRFDGAGGDPNIAAIAQGEVRA